jgi:iron(III) transport system ATP-binding protein
MVTHDQEEALTMADRIVVMNHGVIEQIGSPIEVYRDPRTSFVADFIGTMNFVPGTIVAPGRVRFAGLELACEADGLDQGVAVTMAIRPEDIMVQNVAPGGENVFEARIAALEFLGSFFRAVLTCNSIGEGRLLADFSVNLVRQFGIAEGASLLVMLPKERIRVYPAAAHG